MAKWQTGVVVEIPGQKMIVPKFRRKTPIRKTVKSCKICFASDEGGKHSSKRFNGSLFKIVKACFQNHWGLSLSPDVIWFVVLEQVAGYLKKYPDRHRSWFTDSKEKKLLEVIDDNLSEDIYLKKDWNTALPKFKAKVAEEIGAEKMQYLLPEFSLAREESEMALIIAMMDSVSVYFTYEFMTACGIPKIRLQGCQQDYYIA